MEGQFVTLTTNDGAMNAFLALPEKVNAIAAVIVIQEAFGVNAHIQDVCLRLAREGYIALAPELYHRLGNGFTVDYSNAQNIMNFIGKLNNETIEMDITAAINYLTKQKGIGTKQIAVLGFCLGGFAAFLAACRLDIGAALSFYGGGIVHARPGGSLTPLLGEAAKIHVPILCVFGDQDQHIPLEDVDTIRLELAKQPTLGHEVIVYPEAGHGFFCDERPSYHAVSAHDAWKKILNWLRKTIKT
jgi:carboxymethylenebutenolidase